MVGMLGRVMAILVCGILTMPQGWCCLVLSMGCCRAAAATRMETPSCCCCHNTTDSELPSSSDPKPACPSKPAGKCTLCVSALPTPPLKTTGLDDLPTFAVLLLVPAPAIVTSAMRESAILFQDMGRPRHIQLCVWRC
jgi:hypothetical protein